jgi:hypothetical protein
VACGSAAVTGRPERTARGHRRFRCRECGIVVSHEAVRAWEAKLAPVLTDELRRRRHGRGGARGRRWHVDETHLKICGRWAYLYRAIDRDGNLVDTMLSEHRDMASAQVLPLGEIGHLRRAATSRPTRLPSSCSSLS